MRPSTPAIPGGPLLDSAGRLIGVNTAIYSPSGGSAGIGFAVPVDVVNRVVPEIISYGRVIQPGLGVTLAHDQLARRLKVEGVLIVNIRPGSSAEAAGLRGTRQVGSELLLGDIIIGVAGRPVRTFDDLRNVVDNFRVGEKVELTIIRDGAEFTVPVVLEEVG